jgi:hypothetical protein
MDLKVLRIKQKTPTTDYYVNFAPFIYTPYGSLLDNSGSSSEQGLGVSYNFSFVDEY